MLLLFVCFLVIVVLHVACALASGVSLAFAQRTQLFWRFATVSMPEAMCLGGEQHLWLAQELCELHNVFDHIAWSRTTGSESGKEKTTQPQLDLPH